ncbi:Protein MAINTENANCE OF MERISTEMS [Linum perenne]
MEDVHFITGLTVDGPAVTSATPIPTDAAPLCEYVEKLLGKKPQTRAYAHLFYLPLLEELNRIGEYAWGAAALSWLYRELGHTAFRIESGTTSDHIGDIGGWMALVHVWDLERFPSIARRVHPKRKQTPEGRTVSRIPE